MKKTYIIPEIQLTLISHETIASGSETQGFFQEGGTSQLIKEDVTNTSNPSYNVWDDDWSKN